MTPAICHGVNITYLYISNFDRVSRLSNATTSHANSVIISRWPDLGSFVQELQIKPVLKQKK